VIIKLNYLNNNKEFEDFLLRWEKLYKANTHYSIIVDARNLKNMGITNAYSGAKFVLKIKDKKPQYLNDTVIIYNDSFIYYLLKTAFGIQPPFSDVYLYKCNHMNIIKYLELFNNRRNNDLILVQKK